MKRNFNYTSKLLSHLLLTVLIVSISGMCFAQFGGGAGTEANPYRIFQAEHLNNVRNHLGDFFLQTADISLDVAPYNDGTGWTPLGDAWGAAFTGHYDGGGHTIDGLFINRTTGNEGLFGITSGATIINLGLTNVNVTGGEIAGGLAGYGTAGSVFTNCWVTGTVTTAYIGGGLMGNLDNSTISKSFNAASVNSPFFTGGLIGIASSSNVTNCYNTGSISGGTYIAGLLGANDGSNVSFCYSTGLVAGDVTGGLTGMGAAADSYWDTETSGQSASPGGEGRTTDDMTFPYAGNTFVGWDFDTVWQADEDSSINNGYPIFTYQVVSEFAGGSGTEADPWLIETVEHLNNLRNYVGEDHSDKYFEQIADIDLNIAPYNEGEGWVPLGVFQAAYDGKGHQIHGLMINRAGTGNSLFGTVSNTTISNLGLVDVNVNGDNMTGGLAGMLVNATVRNCFVTGSVSASGGNTGALIGQMSEGAVVENCFTTGSVTSNSAVGGLVGQILLSGSIVNSYSRANVEATTSSAGGILGQNYFGSITNSFSTGTVSGTSDVHGLASSGAVGCYWDTETSGQATSGSGEGRTTEEMTYRYVDNTFVGWDFDNIWVEDVSEEFNDGYPALFHQVPPTFDLTVVLEGEGTLTPEAGVHVYNEGTEVTLEADANAGGWVFNRWEVQAGEQEPDIFLATTASIMMNDNITATAYFYNHFADGFGTSGQPWNVETPEHLYNVRLYLNGHYLQTADIDLDVEPWNEGGGWEPIGTSDDRFQGVFDGGQRIISGLFINRPGSGTQSLFGYIDSATIMNVGLKDVDITGGTRLGAIASWANNGSTIQACYVTGNITGTSLYSGAITGELGSDSIITDCYSFADIYIDYDLWLLWVGGLVGRSSGGSQVNNSYMAGSLTTLAEGAQYVGALIGEQQGSVSNLFWNTDTANQTVGTGAGDNIPGHSTAQLLSQETYDGFDFEDMWTILEGLTYPYFNWQGDDFDHNIAPILPPANVTAVATTSIVNLAWEIQEGWATDPDGYNVYRDGELIAQLGDVLEYEDTGLTNFITYGYNVSAVFGEVESILSGTVYALPLAFGGGSGVDGDPYLIGSPEQLSGMRAFLQTQDVYFEQIRDIDLDEYPYNQGEGWEAIGYNLNAFQGNFDGAGYKIYNMFQRRNERNVGLFGQVEHGSVKNVHLRNVDIEYYGTRNAGGLVSVASSNSEYLNCSVTGSVVGPYSVGLIVGTAANNPTFRNVYAIGTVTAEAGPELGGFVGVARETKFYDCYARVTVNGGTADVGGFAGQLHSWSSTRRSEVHNSFSTGRVLTNATTNVGGFVGVQHDNNAIIQNSYWDIEASGMTTSNGGEPRTSDQMQYPYDEDTYVGWDFTDIWQADDTGELNDGYPALFYQELPPPDLDAPVVFIEMITENEQDYVKLSWDDVEHAESYNIYATNNLAEHNWELIAAVAVTEYQELVDANDYRFFYVVASIETIEGDPIGAPQPKQTERNVIR